MTTRPAALPRETLGVALITRDADAHLATCLRALTFADDIVVLDGGSTDRTVEIARETGARIVVNTDWQGFGKQKNRAIALLQTDWVLLLDADEVVSPRLAASIVALLETCAPRAAADGASGGSPGAYGLDRLSCFCGRWIKHSGWRPDIVPRLFRRGTARFSDDRVHERLVFSGPLATLDGPLLHYSYDDVPGVLRKLAAYSIAGAEQRFERGETSSLGKAIRRGLWAFVRTYLLKRGFLDGKAGFMIATLNAQTVFYRFVRLAELQAQARCGESEPGSEPPRR